ncbi:phage tail protein I [Microbulbifer rhizosphaerae]|uniref:Phage tail-like protein n=1 Tax=Microbulbifer rhizosphaerae TaxID=1562603 RepID=A0A7W4WF71_9GAMM|nr:phage tail-like protein [Microbulbifer rhizosphaerae]
MAALSPFSTLHSLDQWRRAAHENTALEASGDEFGVVQLAWLPEDRFDLDSEETIVAEPAGMVFDPWCRLYRARPELGQVEKILWAAEGTAAQPRPLFEDLPESLGDFAPVEGEIGPLGEPVDLAVDRRGRLFIAERSARRLTVFDLVENKLLHRVNLTRAPVALAGDGERVWVLLRGGEGAALAVLDARGQPRAIELPPSVTDPTALAVGEEIYLLDRGGSEDARIVPLAAPADAFDVPWASALVRLATPLGSGDILVVARRPGEDFLRFNIEAGAQSEMPHLKARHYDGRGLVVTPEGDVAYWSPSGLRRATLARVRYENRGLVTSFQLDSGDFQTQWGRLFIDACLPRGTRVTARCLVLDEIPETVEPLERTPPDNVIGMTIPRPDLSPPMPPELLLDNLPGVQNFYRRPAGNELPWAGCDDEDSFQTYEAPIIAPPGRYLWVQLELSGSARKTPRIRRLRAEYPSHDLLRRLPQVYSREWAEADFLRRYLAMPEGLLRDLDLKASYRQLLLDPHATPSELLPWLASFMGLVLDHRWPEAAKRELVANCTWLFRYRGTVMGLRRFVEIYLGTGVTIIEHFKMRGLGGVLLDRDALASNSVVGAGFRIGGKLGVDELESVNEVSIEDAIELHAHRFSLIVAVPLEGEKMDVVRHLLETHRPAHTLYDICTLESGMRVGRGLYAGLTSIVGSASGFGQLQLGASLLGRNDTFGRAGPGTSVGGSRLGRDSQVG